jgi:osmotically-inducible protein OsmY
MRYLITVATAALCTTGCVKPQAVTRGARKIQHKVPTAARAFAEGSRRLVRFAGQAADDTALAARVQAALLLRKGLAQSEIQVDVEEGTVRLTGHVSSAAEKEIAGEAARGTAGVTGVWNCLTIATRS